MSTSEAQESWEAEIYDPYSDRRLGQVQERDGKYIAVEYVRDQRALWPVKKGTYETFEEAKECARMGVKRRRETLAKRKALKEGHRNVDR